MRFLRPAGDGGEPAQVSGAGPLTVRLSRSARLEVSAVASTRRTKPGEPVTFTATVAGARAGEQIKISWYFDDGRSATGRRVTHRFRKPGSYDVVVGATSSADEPGADARLTVRVGRPPKGPDRTGGGTNTSEGAPDSGPGTGPSGAGQSGQGGATPQAARPRARADRPARSESRARADRRASQRAESAGAATPVRGIELADLDALSGPAGQDALRAARRGRPRDESEPDPRVPPGVWWALGTMALLAAGGLREARPVRARPTAR